MTLAMTPNQEVLQHRGIFKQLNVLEGTGDTESRDFMGRQMRDRLAFEDDLPGTQPVEVADEVEDGRLAGAVRSDQREDLMRQDLEGHIVHGLEAAELHREVLRLEQRRRHFSRSDFM